MASKVLGDDFTGSTDLAASPVTLVAGVTAPAWQALVNTTATSDLFTRTGLGATLAFPPSSTTLANRLRLAPSGLALSLGSGITTIEAEAYGGLDIWLILGSGALIRLGYDGFGSTSSTARFFVNGPASVDTSFASTLSYAATTVWRIEITTTAIRFYRNGTLLQSVAATIAGGDTITRVDLNYFAVTALTPPFSTTSPVLKYFHLKTETVSGALGAPTLGDATAPVFAGGAAISAVFTGPNNYTASWPAATDAVGVTGYEYNLNSAGYVSNGTALSKAFSGRPAGAADVLSVRGFDAAGNRSAALSATINVAAASITQFAIPERHPPGTVWPNSAFELTFTGATPLPASDIGRVSAFYSPGMEPPFQVTGVMVAVALSGNGKRVALSHDINDSNTLFTRQIQTHTKTGAKTWALEQTLVLTARTLPGEVFVRSGEALVSLDWAGEKMVVVMSGDRATTEDPISLASVTTYVRSRGAWVIIARADLLGGFGAKATGVWLSLDGTTLTIGSSEFGVGVATGYAIRIFDWTGAAWEIRATKFFAKDVAPLSDPSRFIRGFLVARDASFVVAVINDSSVGFGVGGNFSPIVFDVVGAAITQRASIPRNNLDPLHLEVEDTRVFAVPLGSGAAEHEVGSSTTSSVWGGSLPDIRHPSAISDDGSTLLTYATTPMGVGAWLICSRSIPPTVVEGDPPGPGNEPPPGSPEEPSYSDFWTAFDDSYEVP